MAATTPQDDPRFDADPRCPNCDGPSGVERDSAGKFVVAPCSRKCALQIAWAKEVASRPARPVPTS